MRRSTLSISSLVPSTDYIIKKAVTEKETLLLLSLCERHEAIKSNAGSAC